MKVLQRNEKLAFNSYEDLKRHRNDLSLDIYGPKGILYLITPKEIRERGDYVPDGWDRSDFALYYTDDYGYNDEYIPIERLGLDEIYALREISA